MAYIRGVYRYSSGTGPHIMDDMPEHVTGTLLIWHIASNITPTLTTALADGWALHPTYTPSTVNSVRQTWAYKVATSDSETPPQLDNTGTGYVNQTVISIEDYDAANIFDVVGKTSNTAVETISLDTPTTTVDNCLVLDAFAIYNFSASLRPYFLKNEIQHLVREAGNRIAIAIGYRVQATAGAIPAATGYYTAATYLAGTASNITIRNATGGTMPAYAKQHYQKLVEENRLDGALNTAIGVTGVKTYDTITAIGAFGVEDKEFTLSIGTPTDATYKCHQHQFTPTVTTGSLWCGNGFQWATPLDLTGRALAFNWACSDRARIGREGCICVLESSSGNWTAFNLRRQNAILTAAVYSAVIDSTSSAYASSGTTDFSAIVRVFFLYRRTSTTNQTLSVFGLKLIDKSAPCIIVGGGVHQPIDATRIAFVANADDGGNMFTIAGSPVGQGGQLVMKLPVQIGDGTVPSYYDVAGQSFEIARRRFVPARIFDFDVGEGIVGMDFKACATCVMNDKASILASTDGKLHYRLLSGTSSADIYKFDGKQILNGTVTWDSGVEASGILFAKCNEVDGKASEFTRCTFDLATVSGSSAALKLDPGGKALSCIFNAADAADYAVRFDAAGTFTLDGSTFSGYTTPVKVTATTGTVTIHMALGQTALAYSSDGATVVFDIPTVSATASITGLIAGSWVRIYDQTDATEKLNTNIAGTSYSLSYSDGTTYSAGDVVKVRIIGPVGATAYEDQEYTAVATSGGWSILVDPVADAVYNAIGTDGSAVTGFTADYTDDEVDITLGSNFNVSDLYAWWKYNLRSTQGIANFFGGITALDVGNFRINNATVDIYLDNTTTTNIRQLDNRRIFRADGAYPVKSSGGGGIDVVWRNTILIATTGGSAVLPADIVAIGAEVAARSQSGELHADVRWMNGAAVIGTGVTGDPWRGFGESP